MENKIYTTNKYGEFCEKEIFASEPLSGAITVKKSQHNTNTGFKGFGVAITGSSCYNLSKMDYEERRKLLEYIYSPNGLNLKIGRLTIGASDYSAELYTYCDYPNDIYLEHFTIERDKNYIIPIIKEILEINPNIILFASPWTPPAFMKTGNSLGGGYMREAYIECYAEYFVKYIKAYADEGINIAAVTTQNETDTSQNGRMTACIWHPDIEAKFISVLRRKFNENGIKTKIWCHDHNFCDVKKVDWYLSEYKNLPEEIDGIAFHYYSGSIEQTTYLKDKYPSLTLNFTEGGPRLYDNYGTDWCKWGLMAIKALNNRYSSFAGWNLMLDETGGPNVGPFFCGGLVTRNSVNGELSYSGQFKAFKHFGFITENSKIYPLEFSNPGDDMSAYPRNAAFKPAGCAVENSDKNIRLILVNPTDDKCQLQYNFNEKWYYIELLPDTLATVVLEVK